MKVFEMLVSTNGMTAMLQANVQRELVGRVMRPSNSICSMCTRRPWPLLDARLLRFAMNRPQQRIVALPLHLLDLQRSNAATAIRKYQLQQSTVYSIQ